MQPLKRLVRMGIFTLVAFVIYDMPPYTSQHAPQFLSSTR